MTCVQVLHWQFLQVRQRREVEIDVVIGYRDTHFEVRLRASPSVNRVTDIGRLVGRVIQSQMSLRVPRNMEDFQIPAVIDRDPFFPPEANVDATRTARVGGYIAAETYSVLLLQEVVTIGIQPPRIFDHVSVAFTAGQKRMRRMLANSEIPSLMVEVRMTGDEQVEPVWLQS